MGTMGKAFFFENEGKRLFAVLNSPEKNRLDTGMIFCHPYADEKQRSCRIFGRFASELCDRGFFVLRFDCRGYGDSQGDFEDATVETQINDTIKAIDILTVQHNVEKVGLIGLRWGGAIAALTAERDPRIDNLILWSPIIQGKKYVDLLIRDKIFSYISNKEVPPSRDKIVEELRKEGLIDIGGYYLTLEVYEELLGIDLTARVPEFKGRVLTVITKRESTAQSAFEAFPAIYKKNGNLTDLKVVDEKDFWTQRTHYEWYFPNQLYRETLTWIEKGLKEKGQ